MTINKDHKQFQLPDPHYTITRMRSLVTLNRASARAADFSMRIANTAS